MISLSEWGDLICKYDDCNFSNAGECCGGLDQCPHITERAKVCLKESIELYEDLKSQEP